MEPAIVGGVSHLIAWQAFGNSSSLTLLDACKAQFPNIVLSATPAVGEDLSVLQAIVDFGARAL